MFRNEPIIPFSFDGNKMISVDSANTENEIINAMLSLGTFDISTIPIDLLESVTHDWCYLTSKVLSAYSNVSPTMSFKSIVAFIYLGKMAATLEYKKKKSQNPNESPIYIITNKILPLLEFIKSPPLILDYIPIPDLTNEAKIVSYLYNLFNLKHFNFYDILLWSAQLTIINDNLINDFSNLQQFTKIASSISFNSNRLLLPPNPLQFGIIRYLYNKIFNVHVTFPFKTTEPKIEYDFNTKIDSSFSWTKSIPLVNLIPIIYCNKYPNLDYIKLAQSVKKIPIGIFSLVALNFDFQLKDVTQNNVDDLANILKTLDMPYHSILLLLIYSAENELFKNSLDSIINDSSISAEWKDAISLFSSDTNRGIDRYIAKANSGNIKAAKKLCYFPQCLEKIKDASSFPLNCVKLYLDDDIQNFEINSEPTLENIILLYKSYKKNIHIKKETYLDLVKKCHSLFISNLNEVLKSPTIEWILSGCNNFNNEFLLPKYPGDFIFNLDNNKLYVYFLNVFYSSGCLKDPLPVIPELVEFFTNCLTSHVFQLVFSDYSKSEIRKLKLKYVETAFNKDRKSFVQEVCDQANRDNKTFSIIVEVLSKNDAYEEFKQIVDKDASLLRYFAYFSKECNCNFARKYLAIIKDENEIIKIMKQFASLDSDSVNSIIYSTIESISEEKPSFALSVMNSLPLKKNFALSVLGSIKNVPSPITTEYISFIKEVVNTIGKYQCPSSFTEMKALKDDWNEDTKLIQTKKTIWDFPDDFGECTQIKTSHDYQVQPWFFCHTCGLIKNNGCCVPCAIRCHRHHDITFAKTSSFFCDCFDKNELCRFFQDKFEDSEKLKLDNNDDNENQTNLDANVFDFSTRLYTHLLNKMSNDDNDYDNDNEPEIYDDLNDFIPLEDLEMMSDEQLLTLANEELDNSNFALALHKYIRRRFEKKRIHNHMNLYNPSDNLPFPFPDPPRRDYAPTRRNLKPKLTKSKKSSKNAKKRMDNNNGNPNDNNNNETNDNNNNNNINTNSSPSTTNALDKKKVDTLMEKLTFKTSSKSLSNNPQSIFFRDLPTSPFAAFSFTSKPQTKFNLSNKSGIPQGSNKHQSNESSASTSGFSNSQTNNTPFQDKSSCNSDTPQYTIPDALSDYSYEPEFGPNAPSFTQYSNELPFNPPPPPLNAFSNPPPSNEQSNPPPSNTFTNIRSFISYSNAPTSNRYSNPPPQQSDSTPNQQGQLESQNTDSTSSSSTRYTFRNNPFKYTSTWGAKKGLPKTGGFGSGTGGGFGSGTGGGFGSGTGGGFGSGTGSRFGSGFGTTSLSKAYGGANPSFGSRLQYSSYKPKDDSIAPGSKLPPRSEQDPINVFTAIQLISDLLEVKLPPPPALKNSLTKIKELNSADLSTFSNCEITQFAHLENTGYRLCESMISLMGLGNLVQIPIINISASLGINFDKIIVIENQKAKIYDSNSNQLLFASQLPFSPISISVSPLDRTIFALYSLKDVYVYSLNEEQNTIELNHKIELMLEELGGRGLSIVSVDWVPLEPLHLAVTCTNFVKIYDVPSDCISPIICFNSSDRIISSFLTVYNDEPYVFVSTCSGRILYDKCDVGNFDGPSEFLNCIPINSNISNKMMTISYCEESDLLFVSSIGSPMMIAHLTEIMNLLQNEKPSNQPKFKQKNYSRFASRPPIPQPSITYPFCLVNTTANHDILTFCCVHPDVPSIFVMKDWTDSSISLLEFSDNGVSNFQIDSNSKPLQLIGKSVMNIGFFKSNGSVFSISSDGYLCKLVSGKHQSSSVMHLNPSQISDDDERSAKKGKKAATEQTNDEEEMSDSEEEDSEYEAEEEFLDDEDLNYGNLPTSIQNFVDQNGNSHTVKVVKINNQYKVVRRRQPPISKSYLLKPGETDGFKFEVPATFWLESHVDNSNIKVVDYTGNEAFSLLSHHRQIFCDRTVTLIISSTDTKSVIVGIKLCFDFERNSSRSRPESVKIFNRRYIPTTTYSRDFYLPLKKSEVGFNKSYKVEIVSHTVDLEIDGIDVYVIDSNALEISNSKDWINDSAFITDFIDVPEIKCENEVDYIINSLSAASFLPLDSSSEEETLNQDAQIKKLFIWMYTNQKFSLSARRIILKVLRNDVQRFEKICTQAIIDICNDDKIVIKEKDLKKILWRDFTFLSAQNKKKIGDSIWKFYGPDCGAFAFSTAFLFDN